MITHLLWNAGEPDPRVLQSSFTLILLAALGLRVRGEGPVALLSWPVAGVALSVVGAAVVLAVPASRVTTLARGLAVVHIGALGALAQGSDFDAASPLVVLPAIWLGLELGLRGAALATASTVAFITVPGVLSHGADIVTVERLLVLPALAGFGAFATNAALTAANAAQVRAEARETELEAALEVIERNRRSAYAIFEAVDVGLALLDRNGQPLLLNHRLAEFSDLAYPAGDLSDPQVYDECGTTQLLIDDVPTARARRGEEFDDVRVWIGADEQSRRAMSISARRVEDPNGELVGAAVSYTDVTDFMRALQVKDDFIALVSHELRTPLTSIVGYVSVALERTDLDPLLRKHLEAVARNGQRLERLVGDLLEEVQHSGRPVPLQEQGTDLAVIVRESVVAARPSATRAGVHLDVDAPDTIAFTGDPQRLGQVVDNLVSNAIKYTGPGGHAHVHAAVDGACAVIRVRDTGIGIKREDQGQLFTRFFRTREATLSAIQGVGLGLSISKSIVESHGGLIEVDSELGQGSEFRIVLPLPAERMAS
ncbi:MULTISPECIES: sensor histidine kinase [unclassified Nocardioides]|uniref:sensor histidine kinase n=1 Tax=unclassified Nocardioides TaxID=2615069 RepID=UPI00138F8703|nr:MULTISPECIES: PAS domain-containing sensor histidine kinase [unclassified Nocardioides]